MPNPRIVFLAVPVAALAACGSGVTAAPPATTAPVASVTTVPAPVGPSTAPATTGAPTPPPPPPTTLAPATTLPATTLPPTTLPPTTTVAPVVPGRVILVGDSVMAALDPNYTDAARKVLGPAGWNVAIDADVNRSTIQGRQVLKALKPGPNDTVVLMLGHNDAGTPSVFGPRVESILGDLGGVKRVFWLTMREPRYAQANAVLTGAQASHPNLRIVPWAASIQPGWTARDGLHLNGSGATGMAQLILTAISR